ncbi:MAG TPA: DinB family protein [Gemmatimonadales bacterium]
MHPRLSELLSHLDSERDALERTVAEVPPDQRDRRPAPDTWSVAEVLDHLARVESGVARLVAKLTARAREAGLEPETATTSVLGALDGRGIAEPTAKRDAPEIVRPRPDVTAVDAERELRGTRAALREALAAADGLALGEIRAAHAALGELDLYQWVLFVAQHERRHATQLRSIASLLAGGREAAAS